MFVQRLPEDARVMVRCRLTYRVLGLLIDFLEEQAIGDWSGCPEVRCAMSIRKTESTLLSWPRSLPACFFFSDPDDAVVFSLRLPCDITP